MMKASGKPRRRMAEILRWPLCLLFALCLHLALFVHFDHVEPPPIKLHEQSPAAPILIELAPVPVAALPASVAATPAAQKPLRPPVLRGLDDVAAKEIKAAPVQVAVRDKKPPRLDDPFKQSPKTDPIPDEPKPVQPLEAAAADVSDSVRQLRPDNSSEQKSERNQAPQVGAASQAQTTAKLSWESQLLAKLQQAKRYPAYAIKNKQEDIVLVRFVVDDEGRVLNAGIVQSHGYELLERESLALLKRASPLPKPPISVMDVDKHVEIVVPIEFFIRKDS